MGNLRLAQQRFTDAEKFYEQGLAVEPNASEAMRGLIRSYYGANQLPRALPRLKAQIQKAPENSEYYGMLGELQLKD